MMAVASELPGALNVVNGVDTVDTMNSVDTVDTVDMVVEVVEVDMVVEQQREEVRCQLLGDGL